MTESPRPNTSQPVPPAPPPWFVRRRKRPADPPAQQTTLTGDIGNRRDGSVSPRPTPSDSQGSAAVPDTHAPAGPVADSGSGHPSPVGDATPNTSANAAVEPVAAVVVEAALHSETANDAPPERAASSKKQTTPRRRAARDGSAVPSAVRRKTAGDNAASPLQAAPQAGADEDTYSVESLTRRQRILRWSRSVVFGSYGVSALLHATLLLILALWVKVSLSGNMPIIEASLDEGEADVVLEESFEELQISDPAPIEDFKPPPIEVAPQPSLDEAFKTSLNELSPQLPGPGGEGTDSLPALYLPRGGNAVAKGSFTVWTNPRDPKPLETYFIVIQIKVPRTLKEYPLSDLDGEVIGTDGYHQKLPVDWTKPGSTLAVKNGRLTAVGPNDRLPVFKGLVQIRIRVPGATRLVRDTVKLSSRMLREEQTLSLTF